MRILIASVLLAGFMAVATTPAAIAAANDYAFALVTADAKSGSSGTISIRIIHKPSGKPVEGAIVFRVRLDMSPEGMESMTTLIEPLPQSAQGIYPYRAEFTMPGQWALKLQAKVQGEPETVQGTIIFAAKE